MNGEQRLEPEAHTGRSVPAYIIKILGAVRRAVVPPFGFIADVFSFDENGDVDYDTMSGFKVVKADTPVGCKFQFESILE